MQKFDLASIEAELKGKTLVVYWYFFRRGDATIGVREVQRAFKFSSPSVASYHMEKLRRLGLIQKNNIGEYFLVQEVKVGFLRFFVKIGKIMLPRHLFYAALFTTMVLTYVLIYPQSLSSFHNLAALMFGIIACLILWYETIKIYQEAPF
ncbi:MAG: hypothetical protein JSV20_10135 [Candidatus Bathyarchaeota archaeon]|nr:MAG: hypothetical protein JSV20_10135 [Candidatus Bathyarchaeota archaeon]